MKTKQLVVMIAAAGFAAFAAAETATVGVSATITGTCKFVSATGTVAFTLDPTSTANAPGTVTQPTFWCTKGSTYAITDSSPNKDGATFRMRLGATTSYIPYTFTYTSGGAGTGKSNTIELDIAASVTNADYVDATAGSYADTVTLTLTP